MRHFKLDNQIFAYDADQEHLITPEMVEISDAELTILNEPPPKPVNLKLQGVEFAGVMCSATKEDMWGLSAVRSWVASGQDVAFEFDNGNVLTLSLANMAAFEAVWVPFRASFF